MGGRRENETPPTVCNASDVSTRRTTVCRRRRGADDVLGRVEEGCLRARVVVAFCDATLPPGRGDPPRASSPRDERAKGACGRSARTTFATQRTSGWWRCASTSPDVALERAELTFDSRRRPPQPPPRVPAAATRATTTRPRRHGHRRTRASPEARGAHPPWPRARTAQAPVGRLFHLAGGFEAAVTSRLAAVHALHDRTQAAIIAHRAAEEDAAVLHDALDALVSSDHRVPDETHPTPYLRQIPGRAVPSSANRVAVLTPKSRRVIAAEVRARDTKLAAFELNATLSCLVEAVHCEARGGAGGVRGGGRGVSAGPRSRRARANDARKPPPRALRPSSRRRRAEPRRSR